MVSVWSNLFTALNFTSTVWSHTVNANLWTPWMQKIDPNISSSSYGIMQGRELRKDWRLRFDGLFQTYRYKSRILLRALSFIFDPSNVELQAAMKISKRSSSQQYHLFGLSLQPSLWKVQQEVLESREQNPLKESVIQKLFMNQSNIFFGYQSWYTKKYIKKSLWKKYRCHPFFACLSSLFWNE